MVKQIILDTNVLARYLLQDVEAQYKKAREIIGLIENKKAIGLVSILVIDELIWVLENFYELKRSEYIPQIMKILSIKDIKIIEIDKNTIMKIFVKMLKKNIDFTDFYLAEIKGKNEIFTFDKDLTKLMRS